MIANVGGELLPGTSIPAYREIVATLPRQNGKTTIILVFEVDRAVSWGKPQRITYSAQTGKDAREKLIEDQGPLLDPTLPPKLPIKAAVRKLYRGTGSESVLFKNGSRIVLLNSDEESGHGKTTDLGVIDESFADADDRREQAMLPAMLTRADAQILNISSAGTEKSAFLRRKVDQGRAAVANGVNEGIAYFEWSAPDDADPDDPETWYGCMPALGYTITEAVVLHARQTMTDGEFRRAMLNQWTVSDERVIPSTLWEAVSSDIAEPEGALFYGVDVSPDRASAAICVADSEKRGACIEHGPGTGWLVDRVAELAMGSRKGEVVLDGKSPAASFAHDIENKGVAVTRFTTDEMTQACGKFIDRVAEGQMSVRRHPALDLAIAGAQKRMIGDVFVWDRKEADADVSPLMALTVAIDKAASAGAALWFAY